MIRVRSEAGHARLGALVLATVSAAAIASLPGAITGPLRVCADPARPPLSSADERGMANRVAAALAAELGTELRYHWTAHPHDALDAHECEVLAIADETQGVRATPAYLQAGYVLAYRPDRVASLRSLDDPRLARLRIGVALGRDALDDSPLWRALAQRHLVDGIIGYAPHGTTVTTLRMIEALADGTIDVALLWEPEARAFAQGQDFEIALVPALVEGAPLTRSIAMAVRSDDAGLRDALAGAMARAAPSIDALARDYVLITHPEPARVAVGSVP